MVKLAAPEGLFEKGRHTTPYLWKPDMFLMILYACGVTQRHYLVGT